MDGVSCPAATEVVISSFSFRSSSRVNHQRYRSQGHARRAHTCVVGPEPRGIRRFGIVEEDRGGCSGGGRVDVGK